MMSGTAARLAQASMEVVDDERAVLAMQDALVDTLSRFQVAVTAAVGNAFSSVTPSSSSASLSRLVLPRPQLERAVAALDKAFATTDAGHQQLPPLLQPYLAKSTVLPTPSPIAARSSSSSSPTLSSATSSPTGQRPTMPQQQQQQQQQQLSTKKQQPPKRSQSQQQPSSRPPVPTSFDENLYTKKLDISQFTPEQIKAAERLAREIEDQTAAALTGPVSDCAIPAADARAVTTPSSSSKPRSRGGQNSANKISQSNTTAQSTAQSVSQISQSNGHEGQSQSHGRPPPSSHSTNSANASGTPTTSGDSAGASLAKHNSRQDSQGGRNRSNSGRGNGQGRPVSSQIQSNPTAPSSQTSQSKANGRPVNGPNTASNDADTSNSTDSKTLATTTASLAARPTKTNGRDKAKAVDKDMEAALAKFHGGKTPAADAATNNSHNN